MTSPKFALLFLSLVFFNLSFTQIAFQDNFESYNINDDLTTLGFEVLQNGSYTGSVTATIDEESSEKFAKLIGTPNGQAKMQFRKTISVTENTIYSFEVYTRGQFKRKLQVLNASNNSVINQTSDFDPTEDQNSEWIKQELAFLVPTGVISVKINIYHNWSGTLSIDNIKVEVKEPSNYYLNQTIGDDNNDGTIANPWKSLDKISETLLVPGDNIFFNRGDRFDGHFIVNGSGSFGNPIVITNYGNGSLPIITGEVGETGGGDYQEAIYINNNDNMVFDGLEINNERLVTRSDVDDKDAYGIHIHNDGTKIMKNFTFRNMVFQNVYAVQPMLETEDFNGLEVSGLRFFTEKNTLVGQEKNIQDVLMEDCYFTDLQRLGVHIKHEGGSSGVGNDEINKNKNLVFRNNEFHFIGGTCILPSRTFNCLIENNIFNHPGDNSDPRMPNRGSSVWTWNCKNTVIQYNQCLHIRGYLDSHGIHIDHNNEDTFVQYNYMEDCEGGFVEILGGNINAVYRFNVSVNDGWRVNPGWANSNHTLWINNKVGETTHYSDNSYIYNNTVIMNYDYSTAIDIKATNTHIYNNIFYSTNGATMGSQQSVIQNNGTSLYMTNNLYHGNVNSSFISNDSNPQYGNPEFNNENSGDKYGYRISSTSSAIDTGVAHLGPPIPGAGTGIFIDVPSYPNVDFYDNPIDLSNGTPNIGACNSKNSTLDNVEFSHSNVLSVFPNPTNLRLYLKNNSKVLKLTFYNLLGKEVKTIKTKDSIDVSHLEKGIYFIKTENFQTIKFIKN